MLKIKVEQYANLIQYKHISPTTLGLIKNGKATSFGKKVLIFLRDRRASNSSN